MNSKDKMTWTAYQQSVNDVSDYDEMLQARYGITDATIGVTTVSGQYECINTESPLHFVNKEMIAKALATVLNCRPEFDGGLWAQSLNDFYGTDMWRAPASDYTTEELNTAGTTIAALQKIKGAK